MGPEFSKLRCSVRQPIEICAPVGVGGFEQEFNVVIPFAQMANNDPDPKVGTLGLSYISFTTTQGVDFVGNTRAIEIALVDGSRKVFDASGALRPANSRQSIIIAATVATYFETWDYFPIPRDVNGPELQALRIKVGAQVGGLNWCVRAGVVSLLGVTR